VFDSNVKCTNPYIREKYQYVPSIFSSRGRMAI
jgi:hypothetical protein